MKLAIVIHRIEAWRGGAETSTLELARLLAAREHDVHIVTATNCPSQPGLTIHRVADRSALGTLRMTPSAADFVRSASAFLREHSFDLIHAIAPVPDADVYQPRGGLLPEVMERNVATRSSASRRLLKRALMAMNVKQRIMLDLERAALRRGGPMILAVSQYVARQCEKHYGLNGPRVRVVFNGVDVAPLDEPARAAQRDAIRKQYQVAPDCLLLLFVAHNFRLKGLFPLIETASRLVTAGFRNFKLLVVGRDNPVAYQRKVLARGLGSNVIFAGATQRVSSFFAAADVCVHPTYYDPCSRVVLEALCSGVPCITTSFNGAAEVMTDGQEGFVIDSPDSVGLWARRIEELGSVALREKMSARAAALRETLSMHRHVDELDAVFTEIVQARKGRTRTT